jgi:DNA-binding NarL/FixJ family response regulator
MKKTTVLLVDDHTVVRQGLRALLAFHTDIEVIGEAENGREAVMMAKELQPEVVLMDVAMPLLNGCDATRQILAAAPSAKVLVLSSFTDDDCVKEMLATGATGYLIKHTAAQELAQAIREVRRGATYLSPAVAKRRLQARQSPFGFGRSTPKTVTLTPRETEVLQLIADGFSNKKMATHLNISIKTVEKHRQQVMNKLNIHEVAGLTRYAISRGMVEAKEQLAA